MKTLSQLSGNILFVILCHFLLPHTSSASDNNSNPIEAGSVEWSRDLEKSFALSSETGKPLFVLFQEIPGCIGCRTFGKEVLTHPLLVEAIETEFHPVLIYNNRPGTREAEWLKRYKEPSWNYQVVRFLDSDGKDIIPRQDKVWTISGIASRMKESLTQQGRPVPRYLTSISLEHDVHNLKTAGFSMACYWTGEYMLGKNNGVIHTEAGWYDNREITLVTFNKNLVSVKELIGYAKKHRCAQRIYLPKSMTADRSLYDIYRLDLREYRKAKDSDQKKQIQTSMPQILDVPYISPMQLTKINSLIPDNINEALLWLSPTQRSGLSN